MKYIRTKDGSILKRMNTQLRHNGKYDTWYGNRKCSILYDFEHHLIEKEADTIKELCDEFVVAYESGARIVYVDLEWAKIKAKTSLEVGYKSIIYGAIWTEWGLKYVAKMNEKGVLELL